MTHLKKHRIWLDKYERREREEMPLGLILCADASYEHVELLRLLEAKLHEAIRTAREQIAVRGVRNEFVAGTRWLVQRMC